MLRVPAAPTQLGTTQEGVGAEAEGMDLEQNALGGSWVPGLEGWGGSRHSTVTLPRRAAGEVGLVQRKLPLRWFFNKPF